MHLATLIQVLAVLMSFDENRAAQTRIIDVPPGRVYRLDHITLHGSDPFCVAVVEERGRDPSRATYLGCHAAGDAEARFKEPPIVGGKSNFGYAIVVFRGPQSGSSATVVVKAFIEREKP